MPIPTAVPGLTPAVCVETARAVLRTIASEETPATAADMHAMVLLWDPASTVTVVDVEDAASALHVVEHADDYAVSEGYDEDTRYTSREARHEACVEHAQADLAHLLPRFFPLADPKD